MLSLFFLPQIPPQVGQECTLDGDEGEHAVKVLRMSVGEELLLSDGKGSWSRGEVVSVAKKSLDVRVVESGFQKALETTITVVQGLPKGDRAKEAIELMTEAGVDRIIPWQAGRSIAKGEAAIEKFERTAREASKQSRRFWVPEIADVASTHEMLQVVRRADLAIAFHEEATQKISEICQSLSNLSSVVIVIGPEGGLTPEELSQMKDAGAKIALMGRPILRSAHAGIAAIAAISTALRIW